MAFIGNLGGVSVAPESTWNTAGTVFVDLWGIGSSLKPEKDLMETEHLSMSPQNFATYTPGFCSGDVESHFSFAGSIMDGILGNLTTVATETYIIGPYLAPANNGLTFKINHGGANAVVYQYTGCKVQTLNISVEPQKYSKFSVGLIGGTASKLAGATFSAPAVTSIASHSAFSTVTTSLGELRVKSANINIERPLTGGDRSYVGATTIMEPVQTGEIKVSVALVVELDDSEVNNNNSEEIIDAFIAGTPIGTVAIGSSVSLANCRMVGDHPSLGAGIQEFPINMIATSCAIVTT